MNGKGRAACIDFNILSSDCGTTGPVDPRSGSPADGECEFTLSAGQSLSSIAPKAGDDVLLTGDWSKISVPWSGTSTAPIHMWFASSSTVGNGQSGTVFSGGSNLDIHGLHVTGVANGLQLANAAARIGSGTTLSDSVIENTSGTGLGIKGDNITVRRTTMQYNGQQGFALEFSNNVLLENCKILNNNNSLLNPPWKDQAISGYSDGIWLINGLYYVNPSWEAGGDKIWSSSGVTVRSSESAFNVGPGLWTDYHNTNVTMSGNYIHDNRGLN